MFALSEVECRSDKNDPTKFLFVVPQKDDANVFVTTATGDDRTTTSYYNHERVVQVQTPVFFFLNFNLNYPQDTQPCVVR